MNTPKAPARRRSARFWSAFWEGLAAPAFVYRTRAYRYPHASPADALRGDWVRVGRDLRAVIEREHVKTAA